MLIPLEVETLERERPWVNWVVLALTIAVSIAVFTDSIDLAAAERMVLQGWQPAGLIGHLFLHADVTHLAGNMIFLWVFGNVVCRTAGNLLYPLIYLGCGLGAAVLHLIFDGHPAIGASGAINGIIGVALAMFPKNRVNVWWFFFMRAGTFEVQLWVITLFWFAWDVIGAAGSLGNVAYMAHIGGLLSGIGIGTLLLASGHVKLSVYDQESLYELATHRTLERLDDEIDTGDPDEDDA